MKRYIIKFNIIFIIVLSLSIISSRSYLANDKKPSNVLVIYSQHYNSEWVNQLQKGINDSLKDKKIFFYNEYLNENILSGIVSTEDIFDSMNAKYRNVKLDCIIVADNYAYNFMAEYYKKLAPDTPKVFVAVNGYSENMKFTDIMTGIPQDSDISSMIQLILSINNKDKLIFVSSENATSIAEIGADEDIIKKKFPNMNYQIISEKNLDNVLDKLAGVKNAQLILIGNFITADGMILSPE